MSSPIRAAACPAVSSNNKAGAWQFVAKCTFKTEVVQWQRGTERRAVSQGNLDAVISLSVNSRGLCSVCFKGHISVKSAVFFSLCELKSKY